jgi:hypothetical protein
VVGEVGVLPEAGCARVLEEQASSNDLVLNLPVRWAWDTASATR